ncbi:rhodanese-like domain-containing protein, partial [Acinetobacter baumannii]
MGQVHNLDPHEVKAQLDAGAIVLVDVREPHEFAAASIPGS